MPRVKRKAGSGTSTRRPRRFGTESTGIASAARPMQEAPQGGRGLRCCDDPDCDDPSMGGGYFAVRLQRPRDRTTPRTPSTRRERRGDGVNTQVYQPKDGVEVFTGIVAVSAAIMTTPWQQPPLNMPVSYFMLRDPTDDPMRGEKELMDPGWFMREMSQYDGPGPRLPG